MAGFHTALSNCSLDGPQSPSLTAAVGSYQGGDARADRDRAAGLPRYDTQRNRNVGRRSCCSSGRRENCAGIVGHENLLGSKLAFCICCSDAVRRQWGLLRSDSFRSPLAQSQTVSLRPALVIQSRSDCQQADLLKF
jgi:hypothetical protein